MLEQVMPGCRPRWKGTAQARTVSPRTAHDGSDSQDSRLRRLRPTIDDVTPNSPVSPRYAPPTDLSRYAWLSIAVALLTIVLKTGAAWITGSVGLLSDAAESLVNLVAAIIALITLKIAVRPPDDGHPFGHSKAEYFSAAVEGVMIFVAAALIIATAVERIITPAMPRQLGIGLAISVVAAVVNGAAGFVILRAGRTHGSATLVADGRHLLTDVITSGAVLLGVALVAVTRLPILDPIVALLAGINILWTGFGLVKGSVDGLMDVALPSEIFEALDAELDRTRVAGQIEFHAIRTRQAGNHQFMDLHVLVPGDWSVRKGHDFTEDLIDRLVEIAPDLRIGAHLEPIEDPRSYEDAHDF